MSAKLKMPESNPRTIGQLNGIWALSLRLFLASYPVVLTVAIGWSTWVTVNLIELRSWKGMGLQSLADAKVQKLEIAAERDIALADLRRSISADLDRMRKDDLEMQAKIQDQHFQLQSIQEGKRAK